MYLYHRVPPNMTGTVLYPLNQLKEKDQGVYESHVRKYEGRQRLMGFTVPVLGCLWNDVLFMSAVPPEVFCEAYYGAGFPRRRPMQFYRIDAEALDQSKLVVLTKMHINQPQEYAPFNLADFEQYASIPQETLEYWAKEKEQGNTRPLLWMHIPHIMYWGSIETLGLEIVSVN